MRTYISYNSCSTVCNAWHNLVYRASFASARSEYGVTDTSGRDRFGGDMGC